MFGLCSRSISEFGLGYTFWRIAVNKKARVDLEPAYRRKDAKEGRNPLVTCLPQAGLAPLREQKKVDLHGGRGRHQNKLACHWQSVKENTSTFLLKGTLL
jgi:hypothetical protein